MSAKKAAAAGGEIVVQRQLASARGVPSAPSLRAFARAALPKRFGELTIRIVDEDESRALNRDYRGKDKPTNVLSFDGAAAVGAQEVLGDLVICAPVVAREAIEQNKTLREHWAHMVVHGCLHLQGYDHEIEPDARRMEAREIRILKSLGFPDPYQ
ncbi:rRNA maturation RNase YbeY [Solimonas flava]|uniref:rRNA maturation RNase YbeY n=1 Tax=Solimonas flava TaxID=415849 RepID=UPI0004055484|nr:rRNA maturation RNase YbeY [Solimonas flava]